MLKLTMQGTHSILFLLACVVQLTSPSVIETENTTGTITSDNYPHVYQPNTNDTVIVRVDHMRHFIITVSDISIEYTRECKVDHLTVYKSTTTRSDSILLGPLCGNHNEWRNEYGCQCPANGNISSVTISFISLGFMTHFISDGSIEFTGFVLSYTSSQASSSVICNGMIKNSTNGITLTPSLLPIHRSYPLNINCEWNLQEYFSDEKHMVVINVTFFSIEYSGPSCVNDRLEILRINKNLNLTNKTYEHFAPPLMLCGSLNSFTKSINNVKHGLLVTFTSDNRFNEGGFNINIYRQIYQNGVSSKSIEVIRHQINITDNLKHKLSLKNISQEKTCSSNSEECMHVVTFITDHGFRIRLESKKLFRAKMFHAFDGWTTEFTKIFRYDAWTGITSDGFYITISFHNSKLTTQQNYNILYSRVHAFSSMVHFRYRCIVSGTLNGQLSLNSVSKISIDSTKPHINGYIKAQVCYNIITVPKGYGISINVEKTNFSHSHSSNECETQGVVIYDGSFNHKNKLGPFCEVENGYLKALFSPLVTSSSRAYIMMYSYVKSGEVRIIQITAMVTANKCNGIHITPKIDKRTLTDDYVTLEEHTVTSLLHISVNVRKIRQKHECLSVVFHSRFYHNMQHQFEFIEISDAKISLCEFFGMSTIAGMNVDTKCSAVNNKCCLNTSSWTLSRNKTVGLGNTSTCTSTWTVAFMKLSIGRSDQNPATLIETCMNIQAEIRNTLRKIKKNRDEFKQRNTNMFPGQIDILFHKWMPMDCYIILIANHQQEMYFREAPHYIELIVEGIGIVNLRVEIEEYHTLSKWDIIRYKTLYSHRIFQLTYHSISHDLLTINLPHRSSLARIHMLYQLKPYKNIPVITKNSDGYARTYFDLPEVSYANYTYFLVGRRGQTRTFSYLQNSCRAKNGTLFSATTYEKLQAIKTTFSTMWKQLYITREFIGRPFIDIVMGLHKFRQMDGTDQWRWEDGSPLTISDWYYPDHTDHYIPNILTNQVQKTIQPIEGEKNRCVMMRIIHPRRSTNWFTVNCDNIIMNSDEYPESICEIPDDTLKEKISSIKTILRESKTHIFTDSDGYTSTRTYKYRQFYMNVTCPKNWTYLHGKCWLLLRRKQLEYYYYYYYDFMQAEEDCSEHGGVVADISDMYTVKQYLVRVRHVEQYGSIWIQENGEVSCLQYDLKGNVLQDDIDRLMLQKERYCLVTQRQYTPYNNYPDGCNIRHIGRDTTQVFCHPKHVFCTRGITDINKICWTAYLQCDDDSCVSPDLICDGYTDCISGEDEMNCNIDDYLYECNRIGERIPISQYCDYHKDCSDGSDEEMCEFPRCLGGQFRCENGQCVDNTTRCNDRKDGCIDHSDEKWCNTQDNCTGFTCSNGKCIDKSKLNNARTDCEDSSDEPHLLKSLEVNTTMAKCLPVEGRCSESNFGCFNKGDTCVLDYDIDGIMKGCPNGAHLINCSMFQCPGRYKCLDSYCIDMKRVCNGIVDCRFGEDEAECDDNQCPGLYRCGHNQTFCFEKSRICNGEFDCTHHHSDEKYCDLPVCPKGCICRGYHYNCEGSNITAIRNNISSLARALNFAESNVADYIVNNYTFSRFSFLAYLRLRHADINQLNEDTFAGLKNLIILDLRCNFITNLRQYVFKDLVRLRELLLAGNTLQTLLSHTFYGLHKLPSLNISNLGIREIKSGALKGLESVKILDLSKNDIDIIESGVFDVSYIFDRVVLTGNPLKKVHINVFKNITSATVDTSAFRFCCYTNYKSNCTPSIETYSSCDDLMSNRFLQIIIWVIGCLSLVGNLAVIICRLILGMKGPPEVCIFALSLSDLLTGIYLIIIATIDTMNRGEYMIHEMEWKTSTLCRFSGVISTLSAQLSSLLLLLITLDRFVHLVFPMAVVSYGRKSTIIACFVMFLFSTMTSVVPLLIPSYFGENFYGKTSLCLAYDFTEGQSPGWEYTLVTFILINLLNCIITLVCYLIIYISIRRSARRCDPTCQEDVALAKTLFILVLTDLVCWFPLIITSLSVLNGHKVSRDMAAMLAVVILPINAALNPYLYTISSVQKARSRARHAATAVTRNTVQS